MVLTALSVNVNKVAWLRNARGGERPSVVGAAQTVIDAGARGITVHPRPDQRHIRPADVAAIAALLKRHANVEFNIEGNPDAGPRDGYPGFERLVEAAKPAQATLVPDAEHQLTSDHGWDLTDAGAAARVSAFAAKCRAWGIRVSLFLDPNLRQVALAKQCGVDRVELYTGPYAELAERCGLDHPDTRRTLATYRAAIDAAKAAGLGVNAGHDLNLANLPAFIALGDIAEVSIGHALIADALCLGLRPAVGAYLAALKKGCAKQEALL